MILPLLRMLPTCCAIDIALSWHYIIVNLHLVIALLRLSFTGAHDTEGK